MTDRQAAAPHHAAIDHDTEDHMFFGPCGCFRPEPFMRCACGRFLCRQCARALQIAPAAEWFLRCVDNSTFVGRVTHEYAALREGRTP